MYELYPYFTNDGSVGLFSPEADDIYHSTYGALTEAFEKFVLPANIDNFLKNNDEIKILDICFGIGYNTKSLLNYILNYMYNETIYTNNHIYNYKIHTDNKKLKVFIHAVDNDKILASLSPFFISNKKNSFNLFNLKKNTDSVLSFKQEKIKKMLTDKFVQKYTLNQEVNILLLEKIINKIDNEVIAILSDKKYSQFFDRNMRALLSFYLYSRGVYNSRFNLLAFLHNIYYKYISAGYKKARKALKLLDFNFDLDIADAREAIKRDSATYDYVFLDAFTPAKCPCLWTVDFFKLLYVHLNANGMILTYSNSTAVRNAFINAGFYVGKIFSESANKFTGTIAVKNKNLIKYKLSQYDLGLLKSKAGIFYRDENLNLNNEAIIGTHKKEVESSSLISSSKYIKQFKGDKK